MMPCESYGLSKQCGENIAEMISRNCSTSFVSLRFTNVVHKVCLRGLFCQPEKEKSHLLPWDAPTKGEPITPIFWNYTDAEDVADAHVLALECDKLKKSHEAFLLAAPNTRYR